MAFSIEPLLQPGKVAFVLCEVQPGVIGPDGPWRPLVEAVEKVGLIANAARIAEAARARGAPVIHCTAAGLAGGFGQNRNTRLSGNARKRRAGEAGDANARNPFPEVWRDGDILLPRFFGTSPMTGSPLDSVLRNEGVTTLIISGVSLCFAMLNLTFDAANRAYQVIIPRDAAAGFPEAYAADVLENTLSMLATVTTTDALIEAWPAK
jgi:nicotinamidase-related amidase